MISWHCKICDKTISLKSKSTHNNSICHKHNQKYSVIAKVYEFKNQDINEIFS